MLMAPGNGRPHHDVAGSKHRCHGKALRVAAAECASDHPDETVQKESKTVLVSRCRSGLGSQNARDGLNDEVVDGPVPRHWFPLDVFALGTVEKSKFDNNAGGGSFEPNLALGEWTKHAF